MRDYKQVINERYNNEARRGTDINCIYHPTSKTGLYVYYSNMLLLQNLYRKIYKRTGVNPIDMRILDCGCGNGANTRIMTELSGGASNIYGTDYSMNRIKTCKEINSIINYKYANLVEEIPYDMIFHGITIFDVMMHIREEDDVIRGLKNCYEKLEKGGVLLWYEPLVKTHYDNLDSDGQGFSKSEMDRYAKEVGFHLIDRVGVHKKLPGNRGSIYMIEKYGVRFVRIIEKLWPGNPLNIAGFYGKD